MRLYGITESDIQQVIDSPDRSELTGERRAAYKVFPGRFDGLPLKVIFVVEDDVVVITAYPLRRALRRQ